MRAAYDNYLENPDASDMYHYYKYYGAVYTPQTNPVVVVLGFLGAFSLLQYAARKSMYKNAISYVINTAQFQARLDDLLREERITDPKTLLVTQSHVLLEPLDQERYDSKGIDTSEPNRWLL